MSVMPTIEEWLLGWFDERAPVPDDIRAAFASCRYLDAKLVDSMGLVEMIPAIEERFGVTLTQEHFLDRRFATVGGLVEIIAALLKQRDERQSPADANAAAFDAWASFYKRARADGVELLWPSETLVRVIRGTYIPGVLRDWRNKRILDVGCGDGNNLMFLASLGASLFATEIDESVCAMVQERLGVLGHTVDARVGTNRALPFDDGMFDLLVSWNVIHYEREEAHVRAALQEYKRVLRPGGRVLVSTTAPGHKLLAGAERLPGHQVLVRRPDDFRCGERFFLFETDDMVASYFRADFNDVLVGRTEDRLFTDTLDWFIATGTR